MIELLAAHEVAATRLFAVARVSGVLTLVWAVSAGLYIFFGGVNRLSNPIFGPLVGAFGGYQIVGGFLAIAGGIGFLGLFLEQRWLSVLSCVLCSAWSGAVCVFLFIAASRGFDNLAGWFAGFCCITYTLRFFLLVEVPTPNDDVLRLGSDESPL